MTKKDAVDSKPNAFTLVELMVVILIAGILATLAIPKLTSMSIKARVGEACTVLSAYETAQIAFLHEAAKLADVGSLIMADPTPGTYSDSFLYQEDVDPSAYAKLEAVAKGPMGPVKDKKLWTEVAQDMTVTHGGDPELIKLAPNW